MIDMIFGICPSDGLLNTLAAVFLGAVRYSENFMGESCFYDTISISFFYQMITN